MHELALPGDLSMWRFQDQPAAGAVPRRGTRLRYGLLFAVLVMHAWVGWLVTGHTARSAAGYSAPRILRVSWLGPQTPRSVQPVQAPVPAAPAVPVAATQTVVPPVNPTVDETPPPARQSRPVAKARLRPPGAKRSPPLLKQSAPVHVPEKRMLTEAPRVQGAAGQPVSHSGTQGVSAPATGAAALPVPPSYHADYLANPAPVYPALSRRLGEEGTVRLRVHVSAAGRPLEIRLAKGSGHRRLDRAAEDAVADWRFVPARKGDRPVPGWVVVPVTFTLRK